MELRKEYTLKDGTKCYFSNTKFAYLIKDIRRNQEACIKQSKQEFLEDIADKSGISASSLHHWIMGHNAPSDFEKIELLAGALGVDVYDILEREDEGERVRKMDNKETVIVRGDFSDSKNVIRQIYMEMVDYIETFRTTMAFKYDEIGEQYDVFYQLEQYQRIITLIRKSMLDIPFGLQKQLLTFSEDYLQYMMGSEFDVLDIWDIATGLSGLDEQQDEKRFIGYNEYTLNYGEGPEIQLEYVLYVAERAYTILEELLKDYLI